MDENNQNNKEIKSGSPVKTGDFETRKTIAALMIIQFISIIVIIFMAGKRRTIGVKKCIKRKNLTGF